MQMDFEKLAARIRQIRHERGMTQEQLAASAGLSTHYIGNIEQNVRRPSLTSILLICQALGATPNDLFRDFISEEMCAGLSMPVENDPYALRDSLCAFSSIFEGLIPIRDEENLTLFGVPLSQVPHASAGERYIPLSELLSNHNGK